MIQEVFFDPVIRPRCCHPMAKARMVVVFRIFFAIF